MQSSRGRLGDYIAYCQLGFCRGILKNIFAGNLILGAAAATAVAVVAAAVAVVVCACVLLPAFAWSTGVGVDNSFAWLADTDISGDNGSNCGKGSVFDDFAVFREARLKLPEKQESFHPQIFEENFLPARNLISYHKIAPDITITKTKTITKTLNITPNEGNECGNWSACSFKGCQKPFRPAGQEKISALSSWHLIPHLNINIVPNAAPGQINEYSYGNLAGDFFPISSWFESSRGTPHDNRTGLLNFGELYSFGGPLPAYRLVQSRRCDLDGDGIAENYTLRDGIVTVQAGSRLIWQSPEDWWVDYFFWGDANNDGIPELNLLVWKKGSYGPQRPFWVEEDDPTIKNHLFIFKLADGQYKPVWQSSNLDCPNYWAALTDLDGDGENELVVIEGSYTDPRKKVLTIWRWNGWGFSHIN